MKGTKWRGFYEEKIKGILESKGKVLDIGGGLRVHKTRGNKVDPDNVWMEPLVEACEYVIMDPVPDYNPHVIGDIHEMPFKEGEFDGMICNAVLEHIENPFKAVAEMYRVLRPGGKCFVYVPFLYAYHAQPGYYKDYWRYTKDAIEMLFKDFSHLEYYEVRGAIETWVNMNPIKRLPGVVWFARKLDVVLKKEHTNQTSGYYIYVEK